MLLALWAYDNVDKVSSKLMEAGDTVAISEVLVLPPRESCSKRVNLDSLTKRKMSKIRKIRKSIFSAVLPLVRLGLHKRFYLKKVLIT